MFLPEISANGNHPGLEHLHQPSRAGPHRFHRRTQSLPPPIGLMKARGDLTGSIGKLIAQGALGDRDALVDGGTAGPGFQTGLEAHVIPQRRFGQVAFHHVAGMMNALPPADNASPTHGLGWTHANQSQVRLGARRA